MMNTQARNPYRVSKHTETSALIRKVKAEVFYATEVYTPIAIEFAVCFIGLMAVVIGLPIIGAFMR